MRRTHFSVAEFGLGRRRPRVLKTSVFAACTAYQAATILVRFLHSLRVPWTVVTSMRRCVSGAGGFSGCRMHDKKTASLAGRLARTVGRSNARTTADRTAIITEHRRRRLATLSP